MTGERSLHDQFSAWLRKQGLPFFHSRMDKPTSQACGDPDFVVVRNSSVAIIEFKHGKGKLSPAQEKRCDELAAAGCTVRVCRELEPAVRHVQWVFGIEGGEEPCRHIDTMTGASNGEAKSKPSASPKHWIAESRDIGPVVICRNLQGHMGAIRVANAADKRDLPRFNGVWE